VWGSEHPEYSYIAPEVTEFRNSGLQ